MSVGEMAFDLGAQRLDLADDTILDLGWQVLIGKIDRRLEMGKNAGQAIPPTAVEAAKLAVELAQRLTALRLGLGRGEIGDGFGLQQIELAVEKGPAGKLAGLREAESETGQRPHDRGEHRATAVQMQLGDILPRSAVRPREPQDQPVVEPLSGRGIDKPCPASEPRRG